MAQVETDEAKNLAAWAQEGPIMDRKAVDQAQLRAKRASAKILLAQDMMIQAVQVTQAPKF